MKIFFSFGVSQDDLGGITRRLGGQKVQHNTLPLLFQWISAGLQTSDSKTEEGINELDFPEVWRLQPSGSALTLPTWLQAPVLRRTQDIGAAANLGQS